MMDQERVKIFEKSTLGRVRLSNYVITHFPSTVSSNYAEITV